MPDRRQGDRRDNSIKQVSLTTFILGMISVVVILVLAIILFIVCQNKINQSYQDGYDAGFSDGYNNCKNSYIENSTTYELVNPEIPSISETTY